VIARSEGVGLRVVGCGGSGVGFKGWVWSLWF